MKSLVDDQALFDVSYDATKSQEVEKRRLKKMVIEDNVLRADPKSMTV